MVGLFGKEPELIAQQLTILKMELQLADESRNGIGAWGEKWAAAALEQSGYVVSTIGRGEKRGDLSAITPDGELFKIEVKTARRGKGGVWQWSIIKPGHTDAGDSDVLILLAVLRSGGVVAFAMPVWAVGRVKKLQIKNHPESYGGWFAKYRVKDVLKIEFEGENNDG